MLIIKRPTTTHNNMACIGPRKSEVMLTESVQLVTSAIDCNGWEFVLRNCFPSQLDEGRCVYWQRKNKQRWVPISLDHTIDIFCKYIY